MRLKPEVTIHDTDTNNLSLELDRYPLSQSLVLTIRHEDGRKLRVNLNISQAFTLQSYVREHITRCHK